MFILPAECKPTQQVNFICSNSDLFGHYGFVTSNGQMQAPYDYVNGGSIILDYIKVII